MKDRKFFRGVLFGIASTLCGIILVIMVLLSKKKLDLSGVFVAEGAYGSIQKDVNEKLSVLGYFTDKYFLEEIDKEQLTASIYKGFLDGLGDKYADYYTKEEYALLVEKTEGFFYGIGISYIDNVKEGTMEVVSVEKGGPAAKAGIKAGDKIIKIDGKSITGKDSAQIKASVKGEKGTKVRLTIIRNGKTIEVTAIRDEIKSKTISSNMLANRIGYIQITGFEKTTLEQFTEAVDKMEKKGATGLILDLRNNGGGLLDVSVAMADRLLPKGLVVYAKDKYGEKEEYFAKDDKEVKIPIAILVNGNTASASEVLSGALEDYGKAVLLGEQTFGKGIVQGVFELEDGSAVKMTTEKYYTPKGRDIHGVGLKPAVEVKLSEKAVKLSGSDLMVDNQLNAAYDYLMEENGRE